MLPTSALAFIGFYFFSIRPTQPLATALPSSSARDRLCRVDAAGALWRDEPDPARRGGQQGNGTHAQGPVHHLHAGWQGHLQGDVECKPAYAVAANGFLVFLSMWRVGWALSYEHLDQQMCAYVEWLWNEGEGMGAGNNLVAAVQYFLQVRGKFPGCWALLKTWRKLEMPARAPPMLVEIALAVAALAGLKGRHDLALLFTVGFHCMLRSIEMAKLRMQDMVFGADGKGVCTLLDTKGGKRRGATEMVTIDDVLAEVSQGPLAPPAAEEPVSLD